MDFYCSTMAKCGRKTLDSPKISDKLDIHNLNNHLNSVKILNFGYLLLKRKLMQNVGFGQKQNPIQNARFSLHFPTGKSIIYYNKREQSFLTRQRTDFIG